MSRSWITQRERSTGFWLRTIVWIALRLGRPVARALLYPITAYFLIFADRSRQASAAYLTRIFGRTPSGKELFRHYHTFAEALLDRVFVFAERDEFFQIRMHGFDVLERLISAKQGFLLVGAHVGSFEILRGLGLRHKGLSVKALVYGENSPKINAIFKALNPNLFKDIIPVGTANALLGLDDHIARGGVVALLGDRSVHGEKRVLCRFLGEDAWFPAAPVLLANLFKVPVILFFCLHKDGADYDVHFELLTGASSVPGKTGTKRSGSSCSIMPTGWSITAAGRLTTGSTFIIFGTRAGSADELSVCDATRSEIIPILPNLVWASEI